MGKVIEYKKYWVWKIDYSGGYTTSSSYNLALKIKKNYEDIGRGPATITKFWFNEGEL